jgi:hypothetical protein
MKFGGFGWDSGNLPKCLGHGVSLAEMEALFAGDVYIVRDAVVARERRMLGFGKGAGRWIFACSPGEATESGPSACASCMRRRSRSCRRNFPT